MFTDNSITIAKTRRLILYAKHGKVLGSPFKICDFANGWGCGALLSKFIKKAEAIAYDDLGAEAIRRLEVEDFPVIVVIDIEGNNLYEIGKADYLAQNIWRKKHNLTYT